MNTLRTGQSVELTVEKLAYGGKGLGRVGGMVVFVDRALPGQRLLVRIGRVKKRFAEAEPLRVLEHSRDETAIFCSHFDICGGCDFQNLAYERQLEWKRTFVVESLRHLGGAASAGDLVSETLASPKVTGFRNKMEFAFVGEGREMRLGLHRLGEPEVIFDVLDCGLMPPAAMDVVAKVRAFCRESGVAAWEPRSRRGFWRHLVLRANTSGQYMAHCITTSDPEHAQQVAELAEVLLAPDGPVISVVHSERDARAGVAQGERVVAIHGKDRLDEHVDGVHYAVSPESFFQTNTGAAAGLFRTVAEKAGLGGDEEVFDLYCGAGAISVWLAPNAFRVTGFESAAPAVQDARTNATLNSRSNCSFIPGDLQRSLHDRKLPRPAVVVTDPPRTGMAESVLARIRELAPRRVVYVSCNPATMARDAKELLKDYVLKSVQPVDMFPHTHHVESVSLFVRRGEAAE